jgi:unsaturated rhamnogalacturonyl hydrolase
MKTRIKIAMIMITLLGTGVQVKSQVKVVLDNYYNHETNSRTGKLYHYIWSDTTINGYSQWGKIFERKGAVLDTLQRAPTAGNLRRADIYIIVDPDIPSENPDPHYIMPEDIHAIVQWVKEGGVLALMANDSGNCEFRHLNELAGHFGLHFNEVSLNDVIGRRWEMGAETDLPDNPIFKGVSKIYLKGISDLKLSLPAKAVLVKNGHVLMAESHLGKGYVFAVGDPWIYNEYIGHHSLPESFQNYKAAENLTAYLIGLSRRARK